MLYPYELPFPVYCNPIKYDVIRAFIFIIFAYWINVFITYCNHLDTHLSRPVDLNLDIASWAGLRDNPFHALDTTWPAGDTTNARYPIRLPAFTYVRQEIPTC